MPTLKERELRRGWDVYALKERFVHALKERFVHTLKERELRTGWDVHSEGVRTQDGLGSVHSGCVLSVRS